MRTTSVGVRYMVVRSFCVLEKNLFFDFSGGKKYSTNKSYNLLIRDRIKICLIRVRNQPPAEI